jgi:putative DNA primase/helicase
MVRTFSPEMLLLQRNPPASGTPRSDLVHLQGTRLAIFSEINKDRKLDTSTIKNQSGADTIPCRRLFSNDEKNFQPTHTIFIQTNYKPKAPSDDIALWKRAILVPFDAEFIENPTTENQKPIDLNLENKLIGEASGILNWLIDGSLEYLKDGLKPPQKVKDATEGYREENDGIGAFLRERCDDVQELSTKCSVMIEAIILFCEQEGYQRPTPREITQYLLARKYQKSRLGDGKYWRGITLKKEEPETHSM